jgi:hypothetical protein
MFHALAMPIETFSTQLTTTAVSNHSHQHCDEKKTIIPTTKQCNLNGHICCLGITAMQGQNLPLPTSESKFLNSILKTLALQDYPYKDYKPPKHSLQS